MHKFATGVESSMHTSELEVGLVTMNVKSEYNMQPNPLVVAQVANLELQPSF